MGEESKIISSLGNCAVPTTLPDNYDDHFDNFEAWQPLVEFHEKEDYAGLVRYCKQRAERFPDDLYSQFYLGKAYVLNGEYEKAIEFLSQHHKKQPWNTDIQYVILDALFALGKNENNFDWTEKPVILRMSKDIIDACYEFLKPKRKPRSVLEIHTQFVTKGYLLFTEEDLFRALVKDNRFIVENLNRGAFSAQVRVARNRSK